MTEASGALPWLVALALSLSLLLVVMLYPLRLDVSGRARGLADGSWAVGGGASLLGISVALSWARGAAPRVSVVVLGHKLKLEPRRAKPKPEPEPQREKRPARGRWRRVDPVGLALKLLDERKHLRVRYLLLDLSYGFRDPLLTGRLVGAIAALAAVLPQPIEVRQAPRWDFEDGWEAVLDGRVIVRPWLIALDTGAYVARHMLSRGT